MTEPDESPEDAPAPPSRPAGPGRTPQLTQELQDRIVRVLRAGNYIKVAAQYNGISEGTLRSWLTRGRKEAARRDAGEELTERDRLYLSFLEAVTQAESAAEVAAVTHWRAAFADDWRAARDYLVRKNPDRWAATTRVQISQEETDRRIEAATLQVLSSVGVDTDLLAGELLLDGDRDPDTAELDGGLPLPYVDDDEADWGDGDA